ncbi:MAG: cyclodeaminase/cyclohydrolase family protein [Candidatus Omnitrophota bacterium]
MYRDAILKKYLDDLAAKLPAPGGGSAAALNAGLGASLISMVVNFTLGKAKYAEYQAQLEEILERSENLRNEFLNLVDLDVTAYKSKDIKEALDVPLKVCRLCFQGAGLCPALVEKGNLNLISDVAVAAILFESAFTSAYFNVEINLMTLKDEALTEKIRTELKEIDKEIKKIRLETEERVGKIIRG